MKSFLYKFIKEKICLLSCVGAYYKRREACGFAESKVDGADLTGQEQDKVICMGNFIERRAQKNRIYHSIKTG